MKKRVLLAEDEEHIAKLVVFVLQKEGFEVVHAKNGREAIEYLSQQTWNLAILDVMMPQVDGWTVLKEIRSRPEYQKLPVLMLSAKGQKKDLGVAEEHGATDYVTKPFDPKELAKIVVRLCEDSQ